MARLIDTINRVLHERTKIIMQKKNIFKGAASTSFHHHHGGRYSTMHQKSKRRNGSMEGIRTNADLAFSDTVAPRGFGL